MPDVIDKEFLDACPKLKVVAATLKGFDNFDVQAMNLRGVWFTIVPDLLTVPTAELAIGLLLGLARNILSGDRFVRSGEFTGWRPELYGTGLSGSTVGIFGMGAIGQAIARRLQGFETNLLYFDRRRLTEGRERSCGVAYLELEELLQVSDFVVLAVNLTPSTLHLFGVVTLQWLKRGSCLVNVCRGSVVDETAVANALESGQLAGYAADVFEVEDFARHDCPTVIPSELLQNTAHTLFTPHLGSAVADVRREIELRGEKPNDAVNHQASQDNGRPNPSRVLKKRNMLRQAQHERI